MSYDLAYEHIWLAIRNELFPNAVMYLCNGIKSRYWLQREGNWALQVCIDREFHGAMG